VAQTIERNPVTNAKKRHLTEMTLTEIEAELAAVRAARTDDPGKTTLGDVHNERRLERAAARLRRAITPPKAEPAPKESKQDAPAADAGGES
jgi:hypothetical protein